MRKLYLSLLFFLCMAHSVQAQQAYAVLSDNGKTVTFYYDTQKESRGGVPLSDWKSEDCPVKKAIFDRSFEGYLPTSIGAWFRDCSQLETIIGIENLNTTNVTNMQAMFLNCSSITTLDLSSFNTENVTNMIQVFYGCSSLTSINLRNFNTTKVTNMTGLFYKCTSLTNIDLSSFNTPNVKNISGLVQLCSSLKTLDLRNFDTSKVTDMSGMFYGCSSLTQLNLNCFDTTNATEMSWMFSGCTSLTTIDVSNFNTEKVTGMHHMFYQCSSLESLDLSSFNTVSVERMWNMFTDCSSLKTIYVSEKWSTDNVTNGGGMFNKCIKLVGGMGTTYDETKTNHTYAHIDGGTANPGYLTDINGSETENKGLKVGDTFAADGITYKVTSTTPMEVQVGTGVNEEPAIDKETSGKVSVPSSVTGSDGNSYSVTAIGISAFQRCYGITSIDIPQTIVSIGNYAFWGLDIKSFAIPKGTRAIGDMAFWGCRNLESISIPESVQSIGDQAFYSCRMLTSIVIPKSINSIGTGIFNACWKLESIVVDKGNPVYDSRGNSNTIIETQTNTLIAGCSKTTIPNTVKQIAPKAFAQTIAEDNHVYELIIPKSVEVIGEEAFWNNNGLLSVDIPSSVNSIGSKAFADCGHLEKVSVYHNQPLAITDVFQGCTYGLLYLYVPAGTKALYESTEGWKDFKNIVEMEPENKELSKWDIFEANGITYMVANTNPLEVYVGPSQRIEGYDDDLFEGLEIQQFGAVPQEYTGDIVIPSSVVAPDGKSYTVTAISMNAFTNCKGITSVTIPNTVITIQFSAFYDCDGLTSITIPSSVVNIQYLAFGLCDGLTSAIFENVSPITTGEQSWGGVFNACGNLTSVYINNLSAWCGNSFLRQDDSPAYWASKSEGKEVHLFVDGKEVNDLIIPNDITSIGQLVFCGYNGINSITIPNSVTTIGKGAFYECRGITKVNSRIETPFAINKKDVFHGILDDATLYVPAGTKTLYEATEGWKDFKNIVEMDVVEDNLTYNFGEEGNLTVTGTVDGQETTIKIPQKIVIDGREYIVTIIAADAFKDNTNLASVTIPETVEKIGVNAFSGCSNLSAVTLPKSVTAIGEGAFSGCSSIKTMELPKSVNSIGDGAFKDCTSMSSVKILCSPENVGLDVFAGCDNLKDAEFDCATVTPVLQKTKVERVKMEETVTTIDKEAFRECKNLTDIDIPESVERIGESAFDGCTGIKQIELTKNLNSIGDGVFTGCTEMKLVKVECSPVEVGSGIFDKCDKLEEAVYDCKVITPILRRTKIERVKIEKSVTDIDKEAFLECKNLAAIDFPESVERIGESAFNGCTGIKAIELPKSVSKIEESAFGKCSEMLTLKIGEGIKEIHSAAFSDCVKLTDVFVYAKELPVTSSEAFKDTDVKQITLHVPEEAVKDYERTVPWIDFKIIKAIVPEAISIVMDSNKPVDVYSTAGVLMKQGVTTLKDLKKGVYIIGTRKLLVK